MIRLTCAESAMCPYGPTAASRFSSKFCSMLPSLVTIRVISDKKYGIVNHKYRVQELGDNIMKIYGINGRKNIAGSRIKSIREKNGWSQADLAAKLQLENVVVEQKAISRMERGERLIADYELLALSKVLEVSMEWLLTGKM